MRNITTLTTTMFLLSLAACGGTEADALLEESLDAALPAGYVQLASNRFSNTCLNVTSGRVVAGPCASVSIDERPRPGTQWRFVRAAVDTAGVPAAPVGTVVGQLQERTSGLCLGTSAGLTGALGGVGAPALERCGARTYLAVSQGSSAFADPAQKATEPRSTLRFTAVGTAFGRTRPLLNAASTSRVEWLVLSPLAQGLDWVVR